MCGVCIVWFVCGVFVCSVCVSVCVCIYSCSSFAPRPPPFYLPFAFTKIYRSGRLATSRSVCLCVDSQEFDYLISHFCITHFVSMISKIHVVCQAHNY